MLIDDIESCYRAVKSRDRRFDGVFYTAVRTTGIYCRPSCPAITPQRRNVVFYRTAAAAQQAGFRACKRCRPDATPGSPEWDVAADTVGRAMRLIADGVVDREGVGGLAAKVGYTPRHLSRLLSQELGAGPLALARAQRAQTARLLIETTSMSFADVAFAAGFSSIRQFNDTVREVYATNPSELRERTAPREQSAGVLELRLAVRTPFAVEELLSFLSVRAVPGVEEVGPRWYARTLRLPHGAGFAHLALDDSCDEGAVRCTLRLSDLRDLAAAVERCRRLLDADCDPEAVDAHLGADDLLGPHVGRRRGLRVPGHVDGDELAVRAVLGQQVSVARARSLAGTLVERCGDQVPGDGRRLFPSAETLADVPIEDLPMPRARGRALTTLCRALAEGELALDRSADRSDVRRRLLEIPGIGPWTADYIAMRALGDPDVFMHTDIGVRNGLRAMGIGQTAVEHARQAWRPWRSYAQMHVWSAVADAAPRSRQARPDRTGGL
ncbi:MAG TPA: AlkA N-terminal domain-containing protein [Nocardioidaceae bacterium]|nr:AlkA N-terminal domain-containing protein [Nocardioidaceae bacterium]